MSVAILRTVALRGTIDEVPLANPRARKLMSRAAYLAARALAELVREVPDRARLGYYLGVGASGGSLEDVTALLAASQEDGQFSTARFGDRGLAACNPLLAFQLMNNFTLCHGAILEGIGTDAPNGAMFSRGAGTIAAMREAIHAVASGECPHAVGGGADVATHPVTVAELRRDGFLAAGLVPADGAGLLLFGPATEDALVVEQCTHGRALDALVVPDVDTVVIAPWGPPASDTLRSFAAARLPRARVVDLSAQGEGLAASAALAVIAGAELLAARAGRVAVLTLGIDADPGVVVLARGAA